jgi:hypothetical protein
MRSTLYNILRLTSPFFLWNVHISLLITYTVIEVNSITVDCKFACMFGHIFTTLSECYCFALFLASILACEHLKPKICLFFSFFVCFFLSLSQGLCPRYTRIYLFTLLILLYLFPPKRIFIRSCICVNMYVSMDCFLCMYVCMYACAWCSDLCWCKWWC